jgi:hypothetical protein
MKLRPVTYKWNANLNRSSSTQLGLIAQEVESVYPGFVSEVYDGMKGVDYAALVSPLIGAVQELANKISQLAIKFTTKEIVTEKLCVGTEGNKTCLSKDQVDSLLYINSIPNNNININSVPTTTATTTVDATVITDTATTTGTTTSSTTADILDLGSITTTITSTTTDATTTASSTNI